MRGHAPARPGPATEDGALRERGGVRQGCPAGGRGGRDRDRRRAPEPLQPDARPARAGRDHAPHVGPMGTRILYVFLLLTCAVASAAAAAAAAATAAAAAAAAAADAAASAAAANASAGRPRGCTKIEGYRLGMEAMRRGAPGAYFVGANHPVWASVGLLEASRLSGAAKEP